MMANWILSWMNTIDEWMSKWLNEYTTCPGFMFVHQKPQKFGNEYHMVLVVDLLMSLGNLIYVRKKIIPLSWVRRSLTA